MHASTVQRFVDQVIFLGKLTFRAFIHPFRSSISTPPPVRTFSARLHISRFPFSIPNIWRWDARDHSGLEHAHGRGEYRGWSALMASPRPRFNFIPSNLAKGGTSYSKLDASGSVRHRTIKSILEMISGSGFLQSWRRPRRHGDHGLLEKAGSLPTFRECRSLVYPRYRSTTNIQAVKRCPS